MSNVQIKYTHTETMYMVGDRKDALIMLSRSSAPSYMDPVYIQREISGYIGCIDDGDYTWACKILRRPK